MHRNSPVPELTGDLKKYEPLLHKLLAKEAGDRFQSAEELLAALPEYL